MRAILTAALATGFLHTLAGPDHYLPFVLIGRARRWRPRTVLGFTILCGIGHVAGSALLGGIGLAAGSGTERLSDWESARGQAASWMLFAFGLGYMAWGLARALRREKHHRAMAALRTADRSQGLKALFLLLFVLGPCEPLIPLMALAAESGGASVFPIVLAYGTATLAAMTGSVAVGLWLPMRLPFGIRAFAARWSHAAAGGGMAVCGAGMIGLGW